VIACGRVVVASGARLRFLVRTAGEDLPVSAVRGWLLETAKLDSPPPYVIEQALWPEQHQMGRDYGAPTLGEVAAGAVDEPGLVSLLLGSRPAGHCLIGTSLHRSLREEPELEGTVRRLAERAVRIMPRLRDVPVVASWSGRRAMTPDGLPVAGRAGEVEGLEVVGGFQSIGMVTIPSVCRRWAQGDGAEFDPGRLD
jgi:glycine/D-amino acid oxidase-like deaminating enzyme